MSGLLRAVRQQRGMTLEELAAGTGLTKSYLEELRSETSRAAKLLRDQKRLYSLVQYIQSEDRRNFIRQYFGCLET